MTKTEKAVTWAIAIADNHAHGYDQVHRWGPDYDCSSLIISAWQQAGVPVRTNGASYTGNMKSVFLACGFTDVTSRIDLLTGNGMKRGDVIINTMHHTVMYIGNGRIVGARINETEKFPVERPEIRQEVKSWFRIITFINMDGTVFSGMQKATQMLIFPLKLLHLPDQKISARVRHMLPDFSVQKIFQHCRQTLTSEKLKSKSSRPP